MSMPFDLLMALAGYVTAMSVTPGPNNLMLLTSGVNFGFRRTIPHMLGIALGVLTILALVGLGLGHLLETNPRLYTALKIVSLVYLGWLAWKIATSGQPPTGGANPQASPLSALEAALFQWVNPKAWAMVVTAATAFAVPENYLHSLLAMGCVFTAVNLPSAAIWIAAGTMVRGILEEPGRLRAFNVTMAILLLASSLPIVWDLASRGSKLSGTV
jgi:threonine/homoserine/homoserine lactone efflux protein